MRNRVLLVQVVLVVILFEVLAEITYPDWPSDPTVNVPIFTAEGGQWSPQLVSDGAGGAIITWMDRRSDNGDIYAQRVDASGTVLWTTDGVEICTAEHDQQSPELASDGAGGAIITWADNRSDNGDIYAQCVDASGTVLWTTDGVPICTAEHDQQSPELASDGAGGAIITWRDKRSGNYDDIYAQRVNSSGAVLWATDDVLIYLGNGPLPTSSPKLVSDGADGAIIIWEDWWDGANIYAQRVDGNGNILWTTSGVPICIAEGEQYWPEIVSDGVGGAIIAWEDFRSNKSAQRIDANGTVLWETNGVRISRNVYMDEIPLLLSDGVGGAIIAWNVWGGADSDIYAQRVDSSGAVLWGTDGVPICTAANFQWCSDFVSDGASGAIITWEDELPTGGKTGIYAQCVDANGIALWTTDGVPISMAGGYPIMPQLVSDGAGGAIITWMDRRSGNYDIYAQNVNADGTLGDGLDITPPSVITDLAVSNPTPDSITLTWPAPGDDGDVGLASQYDIRYSTSPIDEGNWDSATQVVGEPPPKLAGSEDSFTVTGLSPGTRYYFAVKTADEVPNWSDLSNVASRMTSLIPPVLLSPPDGSTIDTPTVELEWSAVDGATSYTMQYSIDQTFPPISSKTVTLTGLSAISHTIPMENLSALVYWRAKGVASGTESGWSEVWNFGATYTETAVTSAVVDRPADGSSFKQWTETTARAYFTGTYDGEITGKWWLDGAPGENFTVTMTKGKRTEVESPFLPTDVVDSTHNIQIKVETPSSLDSSLVTYNVVAGDWEQPAQLIIRAEPSIILTGGDRSTLTAIVKDAENRTVLSYDDIITFALFSGPGILPDPPVVTAQNGKAQIILTSTETSGLVRIEAQIPPDYNVPSAEVTVTTTDSDVQQYLEQIQEYIDRLKNLEIEIPGFLPAPLGKSYDLSGVEEFLDTKIRPPNNPTPAEIKALKRLTFALKAIDHAYYHRFDSSKIDQDREVLGQMTIADDIMDSVAQILLVGVGAYVKVVELSPTFYPTFVTAKFVYNAIKLTLQNKLMKGVVNDAINQIPDEAMRNQLFTAVNSIYSNLNAEIGMGRSLTEILTDVGIRLPADNLILSNYVVKYQHLIDEAVEYANNPDSITSTAKIAEIAVNWQIENIRGETYVTHEVIKTLQWNADIADAIGGIASATEISVVLGIATKALAVIELVGGIVEGSITFCRDVPSYLENAVLLAFQPDQPIPTYQPPALVAHNHQGVKTNVARYQRYLQMTTTESDDFETVLAQIVTAVEADNTDAMQNLLPQLIAADDNLSVSQNLAFSPLVAAHDDATNIVAGFARAYETTSTTKQNSSGQRGLLYSNLLDYLLEPLNPDKKAAALEQAGIVPQANTAVIDNLNAAVPQVFSIPALPLVMVKSYVVSGSVQPTKIFILNATVINSGTGIAQNVKLELALDEIMTVLDSEIADIGELENGSETTVSWQIQVAGEPNVAYSIMRIQPTSDNALTMVEFIPVSISPLYGDVNGDRNITTSDASLILQVVVGTLNLDDPNYPFLTLDRADVTGDGTVSAYDAALVLQHSTGLITEFPKSSSRANSVSK